MLDSASAKKKKKRETGLLRTSKSMAAVLCGSLLVILCLILGVSLLYLNSPAGGGKKVTIKVRPESSTSEIAASLQESGVIHSAVYFKLYTHFTGADRFLKTGKYSFNGTETLAQVVRELQKGTPDAISFTIPEGYNLEQIVNLLDSKGVASRTELLEELNKGSFDFPFLKELPGKNRLEGFLFPDTYSVTAGTGAHEVIQVMLDRFLEVYTPEYVQQAKKLEMSTHDVVTLASIIEREAKKPKDRPLISAVFHNRLKIGMALQSCATVQYALGENKPVLYYTDLQVDSPYNTYKHKGLPPGPIAAPGKESIKAALFPADVSYLYFVAKPDGSHVFTNTLKEHDAAKRKYQN